MRREALELQQALSPRRILAEMMLLLLTASLFAAVFGYGMTYTLGWMALHGHYYHTFISSLQSGWFPALPLAKALFYMGAGGIIAKMLLLKVYDGPPSFISCVFLTMKRALIMVRRSSFALDGGLEPPGGAFTTTPSRRCSKRAFTNTSPYLVTTS